MSNLFLVVHKRTGEGDRLLMFSEIVSNKKFTDLQMNKEQLNIIFFFPDFLSPHVRREIGGYRCTGLLSTVHES